MDRQSVLDRLTRVFRDVFDDDSVIINESTTSKDIEEWDSFVHINLIVAIENDFSISIPMDKTLEMKNVGEMISIIMELMKEDM